MDRDTARSCASRGSRVSVRVCASGSRGSVCVCASRLVALGVALSRAWKRRIEGRGTGELGELGDVFKKGLKEKAFGD